MIDMAGKKAIITTSDLYSFTNITIYLQVNLVGTGGYLFVFQMDMAFAIYYYLTIENGNTLVLNAPAPAGTGIWKWTIAPGTHRIAIRYIFDTSTTNVPVCFIDGILQTPTESAQPTTQSYTPLRQLVVGGYRAGFSWYQDWASYCFTGSIGEIALLQSIAQQLGYGSLHESRYTQEGGTVCPWRC